MGVEDTLLTNDWKDIKSIVLYGIGQVASRFADSLMRDFDVPFIIDNGKKGQLYKGKKVYGLKEKKKEICRYKLVITTSARVYKDIRDELINDGLIEYKDFCHVELFVTEWYRWFKKQRNIIQLNTAVTTWCSLNCRNCNMFMPYYKNEKRRNMSFDEMKGDIDIILDYVDYIFTYGMLGGEPFLNKNLEKIIEYIGNNYLGTRIGKLTITTNGTIIPDDKTLKQIKKYNVLILVSDYTETVEYKDKLETFIDVLQRYDIEYYMNNMTLWKDFGFPKEPFCWGVDGVQQHMKNCAPLFHGLNDKKLYYCHIIWSAEQAELYTVPKIDYIDLSELNPDSETDKEHIMKYSRGEVDRGFLGLCMLCGGCGSDNEKYVKAGLQMQ